MLLVWLIPLLIIGTLVVVGIYIAVMRSQPDDSKPETPHPDTPARIHDDHPATAPHGVK